VSYQTKPLSCDPTRIKGMSERLIVSHYENNYGGAVKRLNLIEEKLAELDYANAPGFLINGLKREQLIAMNSMILHELFFDGLGDQSGPDPALRDALARDFGTYERWRSEFIAMGKALGGGSGWVLLSWSPRDGRFVNQWGLGPLPHARGRYSDPRARYVRALLSHRLRREGRDLCRDVHGRDSLGQRAADIPRGKRNFEGGGVTRAVSPKKQGAHYARHTSVPHRRCHPGIGRDSQRPAHRLVES
jgi:superoxide dismutase, Fe-Mn family